jgi:hypothetical protein
VSPRDRGTRTTIWQGSSTGTCHVALDPPLGVGGLRSRHVPSGSRPRVYLCVLKTPDIRSIMASPGTRASNALNAYMTGHTQRMTGIKYVQDVDAAGRRQYDVDLPDIRNGQAIM